MAWPLGGDQLYNYIHKNPAKHITIMQQLLLILMGFPKLQGGRNMTRSRVSSSRCVMNKVEMSRGNLAQSLFLFLNA